MPDEPSSSAHGHGSEGDVAKPQRRRKQCRRDKPSSSRDGHNIHNSQETVGTEQGQNVQEVAAVEPNNVADEPTSQETDAAEPAENMQEIAESTYAPVEDVCGIIILPVDSSVSLLYGDIQMQE